MNKTGQVYRVKVIIPGINLAHFLNVIHNNIFVKGQKEHDFFHITIL